MKKSLLFIAIVLALISCGKQPKTAQIQTAELGSDSISALSEVNNEDTVCSTLQGENSYDENDTEILCDKDQYIHLKKNETNCLLIRYADFYNAYTMIHSIINDMEVTERYETKTFNAISRMDCSIIHNSDWRKLAEQVRDAHANANRTMEETEQEKADETMSNLYDTLVTVVMPLIEATGYAYFAIFTRSAYLNNFDKFESLRGSSDVKHQRELLNNYDNAPDFDRKCLWALEYAHSSKEHASFKDGAARLEEVMLSNTYSPYLDEVWTTWRAMVSTQFPKSNYGYIPNLYYNQMRLTCAKTILQHIKNHPNDQLAQAIFINLAGRDNIVRHGFIAGNSSAIEQMNMFPEWEKE